MRYRCDECGSFFDEPSGRCYIEPWGEKFLEESCPYCGSDNFSHAGGDCDICGSPCREDYMICDDCRKELVAKLKAFLDKLTPGELDALDGLIETRSFYDYLTWEEVQALDRVR